MTEDAQPTKRVNSIVIGGIAIVVVAIALYFIDADPAFLFESPVTSLVLVAAGSCLAYLGWRKSSPVNADK